MKSIFKKIVSYFLVVLLLASCGAAGGRKVYILCNQKNCGDENFSNSFFFGSTERPKSYQCKEEICFSPGTYISGKSGITEWTIVLFVIVPIILPTDYSSGDKEYQELEIDGYMKSANGKIVEEGTKEMSKNLSVKLIIGEKEYIGKVVCKDSYFSFAFPINRKDFTKGELIVENIYLNGKKFNSIRNDVYVDHYWRTLR